MPNRFPFLSLPSRKSMSLTLVLFWACLFSSSDLLAICSSVSDVLAAISLSLFTSAFTADETLSSFSCFCSLKKLTLAIDAYSYPLSFLFWLWSFWIWLNCGRYLSLSSFFCSWVIFLQRVSPTWLIAWLLAAWLESPPASYHRLSSWAAFLSDLNFSTSCLSVVASSLDAYVCLWSAICWSIDCNSVVSEDISASISSRFLTGPPSTK